MRHLSSIVLSLIIAAALYLLTGVGEVKSAAGLEQVDSGRTTVGYGNLIVALACLATAGALYAVLVLARLSPLGTVLAGAGLAGVTAWAWFARDSFLDAAPADLPLIDDAARAGAGTLTLALSIPLLLTLFSPRRWRKYATSSAAPTPQYGQQGRLTPDTTAQLPVSGGPAYASDPSGYAPPPVYGTLDLPGQQYPPPQYPAYPPISPGVDDPGGTRRY